MLSCALNASSLNSVRFRAVGVRRGRVLRAFSTASPVRVEPHRYLAFYKYARLKDPVKAMEDLRNRLEALGGLGRIYIGAEGLNAQMSVPLVCFDAWQYSLSRYCDKWGIGEVTMNIGGIASMETEEERPFSKLTIKLRERIVQDALPSLVDDSLDLSHLDDMALKPSQWHERMKHVKSQQISSSSPASQTASTTLSPSKGTLDGPDSATTSDAPVLIDCRNWYESQIGKFEGAVRLPVDRHSEAFDAIDTILQHQPDDKEVLLYCTGGIRCEKIGAYLRQVRGRKNVWTLQGGINRYAKFVHAEQQKQAALETGETKTSPTLSEISSKKSVESLPPVTSYFKGINYQFDKRNKYGLETERVTEDVIGRCDGCGEPSDFMHNCSNPVCNILLVLCPTCYAKRHGACSKECEHIAMLPVEERLNFERDHEHQRARQLASRYFSSHGIHKDSHASSGSKDVKTDAKKAAHQDRSSIPLSASAEAPAHASHAALPFVRSKAYLNEVLGESSAMEYRKRILTELGIQNELSSGNLDATSNLNLESGSSNQSASSQLQKGRSSTSSMYSDANLPKPPSKKGLHRLNQDHDHRKEGFGRITPVGVSEYVERFSSPPSEHLTQKSMDFEDLRSQISVGAYEGQILKMLARMTGAKKILEIGSYLGYSALCLAEAIGETMANGTGIGKSDAFVVSCDLDHVSLYRAKENAKHHPFGQLVTFVNSSGMDALTEAKEKGEAYDLIFVDADKHNFANYYSFIFKHKLLSPNGLLIVDNTLWRGEVVDAAEGEAVMEAENVVPATRVGLKEGSNVHDESNKSHRKQHVVHQFNKFIQNDERTRHVILPIRDGISLISWAPQSL